MRFDRCIYYICVLSFFCVKIPHKNTQRVNLVIKRCFLYIYTDFALIYMWILYYVQTEFSLSLDCSGKLVYDCWYIDLRTYIYTIYTILYMSWDEYNNIYAVSFVVIMHLRITKLIYVKSRVFVLEKLWLKIVLKLAKQLSLA